MESFNGLAEELTKTEFEIGRTRFFIAKLPAIAAFDLLELIRHEVGKSADLVVPEGSENKRVATLLPLMLSLDPAFVKRVRTTLFEKVSYSNDRVPTPQKLAGAEDMAFDGSEAVAVYEVLLRCLAVNFTASLRAVGSKFKDAGLTSSPSTPSE